MSDGKKVPKVLFWQYPPTCDASCQVESCDADCQLAVGFALGDGENPPLFPPILHCVLPSPTECPPGCRPIKREEESHRDEEESHRHDKCHSKCKPNCHQCRPRCRPRCTQKCRSTCRKGCEPRRRHRCHCRRCEGGDSRRGHERDREWERSSSRDRKESEEKRPKRRPGLGTPRVATAQLSREDGQVCLRACIGAFEFPAVDGCGPLIFSVSESCAASFWPNSSIFIDNGPLIRTFGEGESTVVGNAVIKKEEGADFLEIHLPDCQPFRAGIVYEIDPFKVCFGEHKVTPCSDICAPRKCKPQPPAKECRKVLVCKEEDTRSHHSPRRSCKEEDKHSHRSPRRSCKACHGE